MAKTKIPAKKIKEAVQKVVAPHPDTQKLETLYTHIQERIADGGATTDHLRRMLDMIKPNAQETPPSEDETQNLTM